MDLGDRKADSTINFKWSTNGADGASITRATDGTISVYKNDGTTQSTEGITDTEDFDSLTGVHHCKIVLTNVFYVAGADYSVVLSAATIDEKVVNTVLATFSIENRYNGMNEIVEDAYTVVEAFRLLMSQFGGKTAGGGTGTLIFRDTGDAKDRATVSADEDGNRSVVVLDLS